MSVFVCLRVYLHHMFDCQARRTQLHLLRVLTSCCTAVHAQQSGTTCMHTSFASCVCVCGTQVLTLLAWCQVEAGEAQQALACVQALQQMADPAVAAHFSLSFLSLRIMLLLGRWAQHDNAARTNLQPDCRPPKLWACWLPGGSDSCIHLEVKAHACQNL